MRDGIALADIIDTRHLLLNYSVSKIEEQLAIVGATWSTGTVSGNFAADGQSTIRYTVTRTDKKNLKALAEFWIGKGTLFSG